jgi:2-dehydropantoate 2-reductase
VGGAIAALLDRAGHSVHAVARGHTLAAVREPGLRLGGAAGEHTSRVSVGPRVDDEAEVVLLAVRTFQTERALEEHADAIGDRPVIVTQNGVRGPERAAKALGRDAGVFGLLTTFPASGLGPGRVRLTGLGSMTIAPVLAADAPAATRLAHVLNAALPTRPADNLPGLLWTKLLLNEVNPLPAITGSSVQYTATHPLLSPILARALEETVAVIDAQRIRPAPVGRLHPAHVTAVREGRALDIVRGRLGRMFGVFPNPASTLQSIRRGEPTEIDDLSGEVVRVGHDFGIATPVNAALVSLVEHVTATRRFLPAAELARVVASVTG